MKRNTKYIRSLVKSAIIAAIYICLGLVFGSWGFFSLQLRPSEALNVFINYTACAPWGLFLGCLIMNLSSPFGFIDIVFGSLATLVSALIGRKIKNKYLALLPSVIINALVVSAVICYSSGLWSVYFLSVLEVGLSQALSIYAIGIPLMMLIEKSRGFKQLLKD